MLYSTMLAFVIAAAVSLFSYKSLVDRMENAQAIAEDAPVLLGLERYTAQCDQNRALPQTIPHLQVNLYDIIEPEQGCVNDEND